MIDPTRDALDRAASEAAVRQIAQSNPVPAISKRWGELAHETRKAVHALEDKLRELDKVTEQLAAHHLVVATDLGPTGNAARNAYTAAQLDGNVQGFSLPREAA